MIAQPRIIEAPNIPSELVGDINGSTKRVHLQTMNLGTRAEMTDVLGAIKRASGRGV